MRLIDADELLKAIANSGLVWETNECLDVIEVLVVKKIIDDTPTVEERPQGEWITRNGGIVFPFWERYECSVCHEYNGCSNYCPNCGAVMRGENK